jgi:hypothetical protein
MGANLLDPKEVLADEAFTKGSPSPGCSSIPDRPRHRQLLPSSIIEKTGEGKLYFVLDF